MKKSSKLSLAILLIVLMIPLFFYSPILAFAQNNNIKNENVINRPANLEEGETKSFKTAFEAVSFAQSKLVARKNYRSVALAEVSVDPHIAGLKINAELQSITDVDSNGIVHATDALNCFYAWLNGQYAVESYSSLSFDKCYVRETWNVDTKTCQPYFSGEYGITTVAGATDTFGYVGNANVYIAKKREIQEVQEFTKTDNGYIVKIKYKNSAAHSLKQKLYRCAGLGALPVFNSLIIKYEIDNYGNLIKMKYDLNCTGKKRIDYDPLNIHAVLNAELIANIVQTFDYYEDYTYIIPTIIKF